MFKDAITLDIIKVLKDGCYSVSAIPKKLTIHSAICMTLAESS